MCEVIYVEFDHTGILVVPCKSLGGRERKGGKKKRGEIGRERGRKKERKDWWKRKREGRREGEEGGRERKEERGRKREERRGEGGEDEEWCKGNDSLEMRMRDKTKRKYSLSRSYREGTILTSVAPTKRS